VNFETVICFPLIYSLHLPRSARDRSSRPCPKTIGRRSAGFWRSRSIYRSMAYDRFRQNSSFVQACDRRLRPKQSGPNPYSKDEQVAGTGKVKRAGKRPLVDDRRGRLGLAARRQAQHRAQVVYQRLEASCRQPPLSLLVYRRPMRKVVRDSAPRRTGLTDVAQTVEHLAQVMRPLPGILALQQKVRRDQRPYPGADIRRIRLAANAHSITAESAGLPRP
jgi:hypothetical protein